MSMNADQQYSEPMSVSAPSAKSAVPFCLPQAIADYLAIRDRIWATVKLQLIQADRIDDLSVLSPADLARLEIANNAALKMVTLTPGPHTPVFDPARAKLEQLLCECCSQFIDLVRKQFPDTRPQIFTQPEDVLP